MSMCIHVYFYMCQHVYTCRPDRDVFDTEVQPDLGQTMVLSHLLKEVVKGYKRVVFT